MAGEAPSGSVTGTTGSDGNPTFATVAFYANELLTVGRTPQTPGVDYTYALSGSGGTITFIAPSIPIVNGGDLYIRGVTATGTTGAVDNGYGGPMALSSMIALVRQESDTENDQHVTDAEITTYINKSRFRLYAKLVTSFGDDYYNAKAQITTDGVNTEFNLPDGTLYSGAPPVFKLGLLEAIGGGNVSPNNPVTLHKFNMREKNRYQRPLSALASPNFFPRARIVGSKLIFTPLPAGGLVCQLWYAPMLAPLVNLTDVAEDWNGWLELVIIDAALKIIGKQERDPSLLAARKAEILVEINQEVANRDMGEPNTVSMTEGDDFGPFGGWQGGYGGGSWS